MKKRLDGKYAGSWSRRRSVEIGGGNKSMFIKNIKTNNEMAVYHSFRGR